MKKIKLNNIEYSFDTIKDLQKIITDNKLNIRLSDDLVIGDNCKLSNDIDINEKNIKIGDDCIIYYTDLHRFTEIGNSVVLEENCDIGPHIVIKDRSIIKNSTILGYSFINKNCCIHDTLLNAYVEIGKNCTIKNSIECGEILINHNTKISKNSYINKNPIYFLGSGHSVCYYYNKDLVSVGCESHTFDWWIKNGEKLARDYGYSNKMIKEYKSYFKLIKKHIKNDRKN